MENAALEGKNVGIKDLFQYKSFMIKLIAYSISRFGDSIDAIAYAWMVYELTGSRLLMGTLFAVNAVPNIVLSPFAGAYADRHSKKKIIILGNLFRGIVVSLTAILFYYNMLRPWHLFIFTALNSTFESFISPANSVINASIVPKELYLTANSFSSSANTFSELIGLALAGAIISIFRISGAILIDGMTFFIACILLSFMKHTENIEIRRESNIKSYYHDLLEGLNFVKQSSFIFIIILMAAAVNFFVTPINVLEAAFVKDVLRGDAKLMSYLGVGFMTGAIIGGIVVGQIGSKFNKKKLVINGLIFFGVNYCLLSLPGNLRFGTISSVIIASILYFMMGFVLPIINAPINSYVMLNTPKELLGRVSSVMGMFCMCMTPLGSAAAGAVSEKVPISVMFFISGIMIILLSVFVSMNKNFKNS